MNLKKFANKNSKNGTEKRGIKTGRKDDEDGGERKRKSEKMKVEKKVNHN